MHTPRVQMSSAEENCSSAAAQHALQWLPPLCGISSTGGLQPDDLLLTKQAHSLPHSAVRWCNA